MRPQMPSPHVISHPIKIEISLKFGDKLVETTLRFCQFCLSLLHVLPEKQQIELRSHSLKTTLNYFGTVTLRVQAS